jgi:hypothetical protein
MASINTITVSGLGDTVTEAQVGDFFSFCGKVVKVTLSPPTIDAKTRTAEVEFAKAAAIKTAVLLTDSELDGYKVTVSATPEALAASEKDTAGSHTPEEGNDIGQEYKPRAAILAEYLSHGYVLGDKVVARGLELDQKHGISERFSSFLTDLDKKYHVKEKAEATDKAYGISNHLYRGHAHITRYLDSALQTDTGTKVRAFYGGVVKNASDVHNEARRLADERQAQQAATTAAAHGEQPAAGAASAALQAGTAAPTK